MCEIIVNYLNKILKMLVINYNMARLIHVCTPQGNINQAFLHLFIDGYIFLTQQPQG